MLGNLTNGHDAVRLYHRLRRRQVSILHLAPHGIACNFLAKDDPDTAQALRLCLAAEDQALRHLGHDFTYAACSALAAPVPDTRPIRRRDPLRPGYDTT